MKDWKEMAKVREDLKGLLRSSSISLGIDSASLTKEKNAISLSPKPLSFSNQSHCASGKFAISYIEDTAPHRSCTETILFAARTRRGLGKGMIRTLYRCLLGRREEEAGLWTCLVLSAPERIEGEDIVFSVSVDWK
ncbi:hypothetical protein MRB53_016297 [Persea americana]|uniref:Uncharacterized protein n=1 Tax=Persea americana TaxID=3435 RepID=A0ACC2M2E4_PERAE|nr:hypothetical protein MRB53_016297 [Persea americana]